MVFDEKTRCPVLNFDEEFQYRNDTLPVHHILERRFRVANVFSFKT